MKSFLKILLLSALFSLMVGHFVTSTALFPDDNQEKGWLIKDTGGRIIVGENSGAGGRTFVGSTRRALRRYPEYSSLPSPQRAVEDHHTHG